MIGEFVIGFLTVLAWIAETVLIAACVILKLECEKARAERDSARAELLRIKQDHG